MKMRTNNRGNAPIIALIAVIVVIALSGLGAWTWLNRPVAQVEKAIEQVDCDKIAEVYPKLKVEDAETVKIKTLELCKGIYSDYETGNTEYEEVNRQYELLGNNVLAGNSEFDSLKSKAKELKDSREAYAAAEEAFVKEDYENALANYEKVSSVDSNYSNAQNKIDECKELMIPDIVGTWICEVDIAQFTFESMGMSEMYDPSLKFPEILVMEFNEDNTGCMKVDSEAMKITTALFMDQFVDIMTEQLAKQAGVSVEQMDALMNQFYGMSMKEYVLTYANMDTMLAQLNEYNMEFTYEVDDDKVKLMNDSSERDEITIVDDTLVLDSKNEADIEMFKAMNVQLPLVFNRK